MVKMIRRIINIIVEKICCKLEKTWPPIGNKTIDVEDVQYTENEYRLRPRDFATECRIFAQYGNLCLFWERGRWKTFR